MEYLNLIAMKDLILKLIVCLTFFGSVLLVLFGTSVLFEKSWKYKHKNRAE